jgi:predicted permease
MTVHFAETMFRWLMRAYPAHFRRMHGLALFELFRDEAREAHHARGTAGLIALLGRTVVDTIASAPSTWLHRETGAARPARSRRPFSGFNHDVRIALRHLRKAPGFTVVAVIMLAVGIGANTTIFSITNAVLLRPLASLEPERVVRVVARTGTGAAGAAARRFSYRDFVDFRDRSTGFEQLCGVNLATMLMEADRRTDQLIGEIASGEYLSVRAIRPAQGRLLTAADDTPSASPVAVISDQLWRRRFGGEPVIGREVLLNRRSYAIVGIAEPSAVGSFVAAPVDVWIPIATSRAMLGDGWNVDRGQRTLAVIGRLRPEVTARQAEAELQSIADGIAREFTPDLHPVVNVLPGTLTTGDQRRLAVMFLSLLLGLVALVLVIACANVGNLLVARVLGRRRELAVRVALGASRARLARMLIVESLIIAVAGGAGALLLSLWTSRLLSNLSPLPTLTLRLDVRPDTRVVAFTALAAIAAAAVLSFVGTVQAIRPDLAPALKEDATASMGGHRRARLRSALAAVQITVSLLLLIGAALFARSARQAAAIELGFDPHGVVVLDIDASGGRSNSESLQFFRTVLQRVEALPGVGAAAVSMRAPLDSSTPLVHVNAREPVQATDQASPTASFLVVSQRYFDVVKTPIASGRTFNDRDDASRPAVAIVNETLAARLWPDGDAIGRRLWLEAAASPVPCVIVGVAKDSKYLTLGENRQGHVYLPFAQRPRRGMALLVRSSVAADRMTSAVQDVLRSVDPTVQGFFSRTLAEHVAVSTLPVRYAASLTAALAILALALALVGLYSLVSFLAAERTHEIGLRMALGAGTRDVLALVFGYGIKLAGAGLAIGIPVALGASRLLESLLYGVSPTDPLVFISVSAAVMAVATLACYVPARRAMRVDPLTALRRE